MSAEPIIRDRRSAHERQLDEPSLITCNECGERVWETSPGHFSHCSCIRKFKSKEESS